MVASVKSSGFRAFSGAMRALPGLVVRHVVDDGLQGGAESLAEQARRAGHYNARKEPTKQPSESRGRTRRSLRARRPRGGARLVGGGRIGYQTPPRVTLGGPGAPHAVFVEFGTRRGSRPQLVLTRAHQKLGSVALQGAGRAARRSFSGTGGRAIASRMRALLRRGR